MLQKLKSLVLSSLFTHLGAGGNVKQLMSYPDHLWLNLRAAGQSFRHGLLPGLYPSASDTPEPGREPRVDTVFAVLYGIGESARVPTYTTGCHLMATREDAEKEKELLKGNEEQSGPVTVDIRELDVWTVLPSGGHRARMRS